MVISKGGSCQDYAGDQICRPALYIVGCLSGWEDGRGRRVGESEGRIFALHELVSAANVILTQPKGLPRVCVRSTKCLGILIFVTSRPQNLKLLGYDERGLRRLLGCPSTPVTHRVLLMQVPL